MKIIFLTYNLYVDENNLIVYYIYISLSKTHFSWNNKLITGIKEYESKIIRNISRQNKVKLVTIICKCIFGYYKSLSYVPKGFHIYNMLLFENKAKFQEGINVIYFLIVHPTGSIKSVSCL